MEALCIKSHNSIEPLIYVNILFCKIYFVPKNKNSCARFVRFPVGTLGTVATGFHSDKCTSYHLGAEFTVILSRYRIGGMSTWVTSTGSCTGPCTGGLHGKGEGVRVKTQKGRECIELLRSSFRPETE